MQHIKVHMKLSMLFRILTTPSCWIRNYTYSHAWDIELNALLDEHQFIPVSSCTAKLGPLTLWIDHHPYASFHVYELDKTWCLPSRATAFRAMDKLEEDYAQYYMAMGA